MFFSFFFSATELFTKICNCLVQMVTVMLIHPSCLTCLFLEFNPGVAHIEKLHSVDTTKSAMHF